MYARNAVTCNLIEIMGQKGHCILTVKKSFTYRYKGKLLRTAKA